MLRSLLRNLRRPPKAQDVAAVAAGSDISESRAPEQLPQTAGAANALTQLPDRESDELTSALTILIPSVSSRVELLRGALLHLRHCRLQATVVVSDHSALGEQHVIEALVAEFSDLQIRLEHHDVSLHFLERLAYCARVATTRYVVVHADDDYMLPPAMLECVRFLDAHGEYVACQGRSYWVNVASPARVEAGVQRCLNRPEPAVQARVSKHCKQFTPTLYAVTRRDAFIESNLAALDFTTNVIFWQYLSSCLLLSHGPLRTLDTLYYLRLDNPGGWRASLVRERDRTHWPYLLVAPEFSEELEKFKRGLVRAMRLDETSPTTLDTVDDACLGLIQRALGSKQENDRAELELFEKLRTNGTQENSVLQYCGESSKAALGRQVAGSRAA